MNLTKYVLTVAAITLSTFSGVASGLAQQADIAKVLTFAPEAEVRFTAPWQLSAVKYTNAQELVVMGTAPAKAAEMKAGITEYPVARLLITTESRSDHADALKRLESIAASRDVPAEFIEVGGWPAVEVTFTESLPRRGAKGEEEEEPSAPEVTVQRTVTAIAQGDKVVIFDSSVLPEAPQGLMKGAREITRSVRFARTGKPDEIKKALETLQSKEKQRQLLFRKPQSSAPEPAAAAVSSVDTATVGAPVQVQTGVGELEIATSPDASTVVIASNSGLSFSTNRGTSFAAGTTGVFGLNDPSLARGASGNFYLGVIAIPTGTPAQLNVSGCTNAISRSTNNGAGFALQGYSATCPTTGAGICFPDQEHIAGDGRNAAVGGDQLYAVWRNFTPSGTAANCSGIGSGFVTASITCSQNNGSTWTARAAIPGAGDFPRVSVGRDGSVYVVTLSGNSVLLNRFSSCANGLTPATGFPVTVATLSGGVACPVAGLDRCNDGNTLSSPMVAPDPGNANHLFVTFAENNGGTSERIVAMESTNSGASFPTRRNVSSSASVRRFMPWSCTTRGSAWVGWYDRGAATSANNDLTDYFLGSTSGTLWNLTANPDPQCASGWPCAPRSTNDSEACSAQPQLAGVCRNATGGGSGTRCDFSAGGCPPGETCRTGGGCPKYGDYNGIACAGDFVVAAWASATAPAGLPPAAGLRVYSSTEFVARDGAAIWRYTGTPCSGDSCPGWIRLDNNPHTVAIVADSGELYQLHNTGRIWQSTHGACDADSCPGWRPLDNNPKTVAIAASGGKLYQLHDDGMIWVYTGTPCSGNSCPGWQRLDNNPKTVAIAAAGNNLYQLHNDGWIWRYTGTPCSGNSCPGWQRLDNNSKTVAIASAGNSLYQLHNDGWIWRYTGTPCSGNSCPGWQRLDNNSKTVAIAAAGSNLYQLHNDGMIWRYTGTPCSGNSCPGWQRLDNNFKTVAIAAAGDRLYQLHDDGWIWRYTGTPCSGNSCPGWERLDNNPRTGMIAPGDDLYQLHTDPLYQLHNDGMIWHYTGQECEGDFCPGWERLDNNPKTRNIVGGDGQLFQLHGDGRIWRSTGTPCSGNSCPGWQMLDNNPKTVAIASAGTQLFQLHNDGMIWRWTGIPCSGESCPGWQRLDNNPKTVAIAAGENQLFQLHNDGMIWRYTGTPCSGNSCPGWQMLDNNPKTKAIVAGRNQLFQLHNDGLIWRYTGTPCSGNSCPGWQQLDNNPRTAAIAAGGSQLIQLHNDGRIWRYTGTPCSGTSCPGWQLLDNNIRTQEIAVSGSHIYQRHNNGKIWRYTGPACTGNNCPGWRMLDDNPKTRHIGVGGFN
ncbi:hypothetical protein KI811_01790 [Geobacter hydrogenophilus]|uniref:Uncharacterized protein n=1 Tax=Geobacter hydrogenophilus TaxID=40983 RepID=A0A9W6G2U5_9BACT|nr:hypothetical protein [Geobacter hydrogenophilus]MBT0892553.1 hypothetical protein [Geobacter hydrogenophilus]GLI39950.1 hypothetical protein GHYDROH2_34510 [Geobacter hydrogenophilus]